MATYGFYLDEAANQMTVASVHPDSTSLERHMDVGGPEFDTINAANNAPMIGINRAMGFRPVLTWQRWDLHL